MNERLDRTTIALRAARELKGGEYVNLGYGMPGLVSLLIPEGEETPIFHGENGILGFGRVLGEDDIRKADIDLINGASQYVEPKLGMCFFDMSTAFGMMRGGHLDTTILGAYEVSERGDLSNCMTPNVEAPRVGGAMDLAYGAKRVIVTMYHTESDGKPKIVKKCNYPLTAKKCVSLIVTDVAVIEVTPIGLLLKEYCPGWTVDDIQSITEPKLRISKD
ncbi:unnamed protein product, partial [marine sediment metagenome]